MMTEQTARQKLEKNKKYMLVRHGRMRNLNWFEHNESKIPRLPARVIIKTTRGLEIGDLVGQLSPYKGGNFKLSPEQVKQYFVDSEIETTNEMEGRFVRFATAEDISEEKHMEKIAKEEMESCQKFAEELNLPMKIVDVEHIFGGERILFYFMAESRIDFRQLVKKVAHEYQTRIEMRQIGPRDEAKLLADLETCGQQCCCQRYLQMLKPVNMRMAKMQKATLDPSKISGYCGRLKCCLRYEDETYTELKRQLPKKNTLVKTEHGQGRVIDGQILTQLVLVEHTDGRKIAFGLETIEIEGQARPIKRPNENNIPNEIEDAEENGNEDRDQ